MTSAETAAVATADQCTKIHGSSTDTRCCEHRLPQQLPPTPALQCSLGTQLCRQALPQLGVRLAPVAHPDAADLLQGPAGSTTSSRKTASSQEALLKGSTAGWWSQP
jgi:hypothetical protein